MFEWWRHVGIVENEGPLEALERRDLRVSVLSAGVIHRFALLYT